MSSRRRRRGNTAEPLPEDDNEEEEQPPAPSAAAETDDDDDDDDPNDPAARVARTGRTKRSESKAAAAERRSTTRANLRQRQRVQDDHAPSTLAKFFATVRACLFGSKDHYFLSRYQVAASTPLQMTMYFNIPYALLFLVTNQLLFAWKSAVWDLPIVVAVISPMVFWVWAFVEPIRLLLGYVGNLSERVAWLGGFWILTVFPQAIVHIYFIVGQWGIGWFTLPIEVAMSSVYLVLVIAQLLLSYSTIKRLVAKVPNASLTICPHICLPSAPALPVAALTHLQPPPLASVCTLAVVQAMADFHLTPLDNDEASQSL